MKTWNATALLAMTCLVTACAADPSETDEGARRQPRVLGQIHDLAAAATPDQTTLIYGADVVRLYPPEAKRPAGLSESYDVLDAWPVHGAKGPVRLLCGGSAGEMCVECGQSSCASGPPPPDIHPDADDPNKIAFRRSGLAFPSGAGVIRIGGAPGMLVSAGASPPSLDDLRAKAWSWVKGQKREMVLHLYNVVDPARVHPLHNTVVAIPVPEPVTF